MYVVLIIVSIYSIFIANLMAQGKLTGAEGLGNLAIAWIIFFALKLGGEFKKE